MSITGYNRVPYSKWMDSLTSRSRWYYLPCRKQQLKVEHSRGVNDVHDYNVGGGVKMPGGIHLMTI